LSRAAAAVAAAAATSGTPEYSKPPLPDAGQQYDPSSDPTPAGEEEDGGYGEEESEMMYATGGTGAESAGPDESSLAVQDPQEGAQEGEGVMEGQGGEEGQEQEQEHSGAAEEEGQQS
jgi:hypothetical protein